MVKAIPTTKKMLCLRRQTSFKRFCVESVAGIGRVLGCRLRKRNISTAHKLYKRTQCMNECQFIKWFQCSTKANVRQAGMAYKTLHGSLGKLTANKNGGRKHVVKGKRQKRTSKYSGAVLRASDISRVTGKIACYQTRCTKGRVDIQKVAGIGNILGCRLRQLGIKTAKQLQTKTKCLSVCEFKVWMCKQVGANPFQSSLAYTCLHECAPKKLLKEKLCSRTTKC